MESCSFSETVKPTEIKSSPLRCSRQLTTRLVVRLLGVLLATIGVTANGQEATIKTGEYVDTAFEDDVIELDGLTLEDQAVIAIPFSKERQVFRVGKLVVNGTAFIYTYPTKQVLPMHASDNGATAESGYGDGLDGSPGLHGSIGVPSPEIEFRIAFGNVERLVLFAWGGPGQGGGRGGDGGTGKDCECASFTHGGNGGKNGVGGDGGKGGKGSKVTFFYSGTPCNSSTIPLPRTSSTAPAATMTPTGMFDLQDTKTGAWASYMDFTTALQGISSSVGIQKLRLKTITRARSPEKNEGSLHAMLRGLQLQETTSGRRDAANGGAERPTDPKPAYASRTGIVAYVNGGPGGPGGLFGNPGAGGAACECSTFGVKIYKLAGGSNGKWIRQPGNDGEIGETGSLLLKSLQ